MIEQPIRVLVADDDPAVRRVLKVFLADAGDMTIVGEAECGREAAEMIERLRPDVALLDCTMPDLGGTEVVRLAEGLPGNVGLVVLDTYGDRALAAVEAGASARRLQEALRERLLETIRRAVTPSSDKPARDAQKEAPHSDPRQTESD